MPLIHIDNLYMREADSTQTSILNTFHSKVSGLAKYDLVKKECYGLRHYIEDAEAARTKFLTYRFRPKSTVLNLACIFLQGLPHEGSTPQTYRFIGPTQLDTSCSRN